MIATKLFGEVDGQPAYLYTLTNKHEMEALITNYGATLVALKVPDRTGKLDDIVLGYDNLDAYVTCKFFLGGTIGRYANRIAQGEFVLDGINYNLAKNDGPNSLHGGIRGFHKRVWHAKESSDSEGESLAFSYLSEDGDQGYPGNLAVFVVYTLLKARNELRIEYRAIPNKKTVLNLTNHSYFNLAGHGSGDILRHQLMLRAREFTPVDANLIPTGELRDVKGTPFDFLEPTAIGSSINESDEQLKIGKGYDHNWVLSRPGDEQVSSSAACAYDPKSGRALEVTTTEPGIQFYSGNFLDGTLHGKNGTVYGYRSGFCLETQHFPNSPNQPSFPTTELEAEQSFRSVTVMRFSAR